MLVLARENQQEVVLTIPPHHAERTIHVKVVRIGDGRVRLGFEADRDVSVVRRELVTTGERNAAGT